MFSLKPKNPFIVEADRAKAAIRKTLEATRQSIVRLKKEQEILKQKTVHSPLLAGKDPRIEAMESFIQIQSSLMLYITSAADEVVIRRQGTRDKTINHNAQAMLTICDYTNGFVKDPSADKYAALRAGQKIVLSELAHIPAFAKKVESTPSASR